MKLRDMHVGDVKADPVLVALSKENNDQMSQFYRWLDLSGDETVNWICDQLYCHHEGRLIGPRGAELTLDQLRPETHFGQDTRRTINRYKSTEFYKRTRGLTPQKLPRVLLMDFALQVYLGRIVID